MDLIWIRLVMADSTRHHSNDGKRNSIHPSTPLTVNPQLEYTTNGFIVSPTPSSPSFSVQFDERVSRVNQLAINFQSDEIRLVASAAEKICIFFAGHLRKLPPISGWTVHSCLATFHITITIIIVIVTEITSRIRDESK